jgi:hypothetical protein
MGNGNTRLHCFAGCAQQSVIDAVGLRWADLRPDTGFKPSAAMWRVWELEREEEAMHRAWPLAEWLSVIEPWNRGYWRSQAQDFFERWYWLRCTLYPSEKKARDRQAEARRIIAEYGEDELWEYLPLRNK